MHLCAPSDARTDVPQDPFGQNRRWLAPAESGHERKFACIKLRVGKTLHSSHEACPSFAGSVPVAVLSFAKKADLGAFGNTPLGHQSFRLT